MYSVNKAILVGNVGRDPEVRTLANGNAVANLSVATTEKWRDKQSGEMKERTEWHRVVAFGPLAMVIQNHVRKGSKVYVEGAIGTRKWTDKAGVEKFSTEITLQGFNATLIVLDGKGEGAATAPPPIEKADDDSSIPF